MIRHCCSSFMSKPNVYTAIIEEIFESKFKKGMTRVDFERTDITAAADRRGVPRPSNVGDVVYSARYRGRVRLFFVGGR